MAAGRHRCEWPARRGVWKAGGMELPTPTETSFGSVALFDRPRREPRPPELFQSRASLGDRVGHRVQHDNGRMDAEIGLQSPRMGACGLLSRLNTLSGAP